ncbi:MULTISPECIES: zeta toxin family protein [Acidobacteriaceae]|uniref:zeta toxin family protein n=1 Tax=Acidobacteriaceae TaxID=204434 RepID=UPI00131ADFBE|nr:MULTISPECIES: zeta toxin family protein [Acidobacteriaceae]MDW5265348.1 zeta toxin family protein [Edaphobacter sp.]
MSRPVLTIIAGSNGCGKSTLTSSARDKFQQSPILDPDAIAKSIQETLISNHSDIEAGKRLLRLAEEFIAAQQSFTVETTLSGSTYLRMATRAKKANFNIMVVFIGTVDVEINIERVKARVKKGGHDVSEEDQRRRYPRTLANMKRLLPDADLAVILDNSTETGYVLVAFGHKGYMHWNEPVPKWATSFQM